LGRWVVVRSQPREQPKGQGYLPETLASGGPYG